MGRWTKVIDGEACDRSEKMEVVMMDYFEERKGDVVSILWSERGSTEQGEGKKGSGSDD